MAALRAAAALAVAVLAAAAAAAAAACTFGCTANDVQVVLASEPQLAAVRLFDMDGDRDLEVAVLERSAVGPVWFAHNGSGWEEAGAVHSSASDGPNPAFGMTSFGIAHLNGGRPAASVPRGCVRRTRPGRG